jgi:hypothetical protein
VLNSIDLDSIQFVSLNAQITAKVIKINQECGFTENWGLSVKDIPTIRGTFTFPALSHFPVINNLIRSVIYAFKRGKGFEVGNISILKTFGNPNPYQEGVSETHLRNWYLNY